MNILSLLWNGLQATLAWALSHPDEAAQTGVIIAAGVGALRRWAVAKKADRFAQFVDALGRSAAFVINQVGQAPPGTDLVTFKQQLIAAELKRQLAEYAETVKKIGATPLKAELILTREMDKLEANRPVVNIIREAAQAVTGEPQRGVESLPDMIDGLAVRGG